MYKNIAAIAFILFTFGILVALRFDVPASFPTTISHVYGSSTFTANQSLKRGQFIKTGKGEYLDILIGSSTHIAMDENSTIELKRLFQKDISIGFTRGRIVVNNQSSAPVEIETNQTRSILGNGDVVTFVDYDFRDLVSVIPFHGTVSFFLKDGSNKQTLTTGTTIREVPPIMFTPATLDKTKGVYAEFYAWVDSTTNK